MALQGNTSAITKTATARHAELSGFVQQYDQLTDVLNDLPKKLHHEVLVPFGDADLAFFPKGRLVHTNEVVMHLGDCWYSIYTLFMAMQFS